MAARIASKSRSKIATPDLSRSLQRGISVASGNWAHQASVRRSKQRWVACSSTSAATASASSTPPATATAASTSSAATEAPTSATTPTPTPSSASTATTAAPTTPSSSLALLALADAAPLTRSRRSADRLGANKVDSSSRGNRGQKRNRGAPLKERGTGVTTRGAYGGNTSLCCKEALLEEVDIEGGRAKREEVVPDRAESVRESKFGDEAERPRWVELLRSGVAIFDLDYDAILAAMYAFCVSAEGDCYMCVPHDPSLEAASLAASESEIPGTMPAEALHTFTLDSGASRYFFRDSTTLTPLSAPVLVKLADPSGGPILARSSTVLPCPAVPYGSLLGLQLSSFSTNLVSTAAL
ncbi:unnamed protein product [Closterium sp. NIES-54]